MNVVNEPLGSWLPLKKKKKGGIIMGKYAIE